MSGVIGVVGRCEGKSKMVLISQTVLGVLFPNL